MVESRWLRSRTVTIELWAISFQGIGLVCFTARKGVMGYIFFLVFLRQPFSQVIVFIDWREDTQYLEGSVDYDFGLR